MLKKLLDKGLLKDAGNILQIFKDNKGRFSSKRTIAGAIVALAAADIANTGKLDWIHVILCAVAASIVLFAPALESKTTDQYPEK